MNRYPVLLCLVVGGMLTEQVGAQTVVYDSSGFELESSGGRPEGWTPFLHSRPNVVVARGGANGSRFCLKGRRSESGGLTALSRTFAAPASRVKIEFSFAFSESRGRTLNVWTHEPNGKDASQLNLCVQGGKLMQFEGTTMTWETISENVVATRDPSKPVWHRLRIILDRHQPGIDYWLSEPHGKELPEKPITMAAYRTNLAIGAIAMVSGKRVAPGGWYLIDDLVVSASDYFPAPHAIESPETVALWTGPLLPKSVAELPFVPGVEHRTIHRATEKTDKFLHGASIVHHKGTWFANWANSPTNENGPHETLRGRRSIDGGKSWSDVEVIGPGFEGDQRHSHGVLFSHQGEVWALAARFGVGAAGRRFRGLTAEAFVLDEAADRWRSRGIVMQNCWPYDEPVVMGNGNYIVGGQDKDGLPVVAISEGDDFRKWHSVLIPFHRRLKPSFAETTVWAEGQHVTAIIRGGAGVAWVSKSDDHGRTWSTAAPSNFPMPRAKAYLGKLSDQRLYLLSNFNDRNTLVISVSEPGGSTFTRMWKIRDGESEPPRFSGNAKGKQWSYPFGYEHDGKLHVVYSIGKEDCGLSVIPIGSLRMN